MRKFIIKGTKQITLPVTPESFELSVGRRTETVNIHEVGDVNLPGGMALGTIKISCMFPKNDYPFALDFGNPYDYVGQLGRLVKRKKPIRFVVSGTGINEQVLLEEISYGERDGTGDVYAAITMRGYRRVAASRTAEVDYALPAGEASPLAAGGNRPRDCDRELSAKQLYPGKKGQSFYEICRAVYGDGSSANAIRLANYNGYGSLHLLLEKDRTVKCPPLSSLEQNAYRDLSGSVE